MKVGINILLWTTKLTEQDYPLLEKIKMTGYDGIEIPVFEIDSAYYQQIAQQAKSLDLEITTVTINPSGANPVSSYVKSREAALAHLKQAVDCSAVMGASVMGGPFHSAYSTFTGASATSDEMKWSADVMREVAEYAEEMGVVIAPEIVNRFECYLVNTTEQAAELCQLVNHRNFGFHYDTHHAHIEEKNIRQAIESTSTYLKHFHVSENDRGTPGRGQVNWHETFKALDGMHYDGWLTLESFRPGIPDFSERINIWRDYSPQDEVIEEGYSFINKMWNRHCVHRIGKYFKLVG